MRRGPPVTRLAVAFAGGAVLGQLPGGSVPVVGLSLLLLALIDAWLRPTGRRVPTFAVALAGVCTTAAAGSDCAPPAHGAALTLAGYFQAPTRGRGGAFRAQDLAGCGTRDVTVLVRSEIAAGAPVDVHGRWRAGAGGGLLVASSVERHDGVGPPLVRWRGALVERLDTMYGARAPVVSALVLARKEGLPSEVREAFARSGTAHLLAISGFHVGVVAALVLTLLRKLRLSRRRAALAASMVTWLYVALLGFPDAACRAALILAAVAASRARGRPPARWGALASALLVLVALDPATVASPGFQLSFAGAAGLVAWSRAIGSWLGSTLGRRVPAAFLDALAAGIAATVATLPIVAWHFERVALVGIPVTLVASPLVAVLLPGALASLVADALHPAAGAFLAGGVDLGLRGLEGIITWASAPSWASVWVPRSWVPAFVVGGAAGGVLAARARPRPRRRRLARLLVGAAGVVLWPVAAALGGRGTLEVVAIDVGQGDAVALRSPRGRWIVIDAGPPWPRDPERPPVVAELRRRGVTRIEMLVLTHPDLDHFGGAVPVLDAFDVRGVLDPGLAAGKAGFVEVLEAARRRGVPWRAATATQRIELDGVEIEVLHPLADSTAAGVDANDASVVLLARYGAFEALLTGDAPVEVERTILQRLPRRLEVLKVGHHGSTTSTAPELVARTSPAVALVSAGRGNRYGHPAPAVLARLEGAAVDVRRTDVHGTVRVIGRRDGSFRVESGRVPR